MNIFAQIIEHLPTPSYISNAVIEYRRTQGHISSVKRNSATTKPYYWRDSHDEVDYALHRREKTIAIEVKSGRRTTNKGLSKFTQAYHPHRALVVGSGGLSFEEFLLMDLELLFK